MPQASSALESSATGSQLDDIVRALQTTGWIVVPDFLPASDWQPLMLRALAIDDYNRAAIGRGEQQQVNNGVRTDRVAWMEADDPTDQAWLRRMECLRLAINERLFLGLFEHEAHYARYEPGAFYTRHVDALHGESNRVVSTVLYLNPEWEPADGGELVLYADGSSEGRRISPIAGTLVAFLSEVFAHEVLPTQRTRHSIAGWFRVNGSTGARVDPAR
ncbi:MAG: 2OG-Fe(II) oxygenase [Chromatiales bacterium]|nr:2OG-Fe(II) oxygenase [Chromatiales bacterium]